MIEPKRGRLWRGMFLVCILAMLPGCTPGLFPSDDVVSKEPNDDFLQAQAVDADVLRTVTISGSFSFQNNLDVFLLGDLKAGETISVSVSGSSLIFGKDLSLVIFDGDLNAANAADITPTTRLANAMTHIVRKAGNYYLAIYQPETGSQSYTVQITLGSGTVPNGKAQTVYLYFGGISYLKVGGEVFRNLQPFSAITLNINHATVAADVLQRVRNDFGNLNITVLSSYDTATPAVAHSTVYVTGSTGPYYGLANSIDWYNADHTDNAVVFAGALAQDTTSTSRFPQMLANVITHETGHLLGLIHTDDNTELMDISTPTMMLEMDQNFHRARLAYEEFPIGWEDTLELLRFALGVL